MKKCPYCNADLQDEASFCLYCMRSLTKKEIIESPKSRLPKKIKIIICIVLAVILAITSFTFTMIQNSKICTFSRFNECFIAANEKLNCTDLWTISELKDYYTGEDWTTYSLPLKNDDIELTIYFYKGGKEILTVIGEIPEQDLEDTKKMALCITDSIANNYITDFMDILNENRNYRFSENAFSYPKNITDHFKFIKDEDAENAHITSKHIESKIENSKIRIFYENLTFDYGNKMMHKMILYYYTADYFKQQN